MPIAKIPYQPSPLAAEATEAPYGLGRPMLFQVTEVGSLEPLWPYLLALHTNPGTLHEQFAKSKSVVMTVGGFVEFVWPDELDTLSADATTGAFIGPDSGLTADSANPKYQMRRGSDVTRQFRGRHGTMAWERMQDFLELYRSNGQIFDGAGTPVLRSQIICMYDRGIYTGWFTTFEVVDTSDMPFQFKLSWEFKISQTIYALPIDVRIPGEDDSPVQQATPDVADVEQRIRNLGNTEPVDPAVLAIMPTTSPLPEMSQQQLIARASARDRNIPK